MRWRRMLPAALVALACAGVASSVGAQPSEYEVKAAFLLNFARYVEWPAQSFAAADAPLILCVIGRDPFGAAWGVIEGRSVQGRPVRLRRGIEVEQLAGCHVAFLPEAEERRQVALLRQSAGLAVLTVSDIESFADAGGGIALVHSDERLQFEVNSRNLAQAQLRASSRLLSLARSVIGGRGKP